MTDFLLELRSEEIPARMQDKARDDLARLFAAELARAGLHPAATVTFATPRRLALIVRGLPQATDTVREEVKGPKTAAPPQALEGFLRKTGLTREALTERDGVFFAVTEKPGRATAAVLADAIPAVIRAFPWPKSMRWGAASASTESLRWVRPLHGIVALFGEEIVPVEIAGITSGATTYGHRFHHPGPITIGSAADYEEKLRACHVVVDQDQRRTLIRDRATALAAEAGLDLIEDEGLVAENAGLTEWPVPLLGRFDPDFLSVPPEVIQLTARVNQKYFVCRGADEKLADAFVCTANIDATDGGTRIVEGNRKVLAARLSDARFFYDTDLKVPLGEQAKKLDRIVFHEKLGTVADKVDRVAKLARWLVEEGIVTGEGRTPTPTVRVERSRDTSPSEAEAPASADLDFARSSPSTSLGTNGDGADREELAALAERAARLCKADLVTGMVGEFPELQGLMGGYYAEAQGEHPAVAAAIRDHYKPVGQGDEVPTAPVTVAVSLADKLDTILSFFLIQLQPTGSRDPFALRRAALGFLAQVVRNNLRFELGAPLFQAAINLLSQAVERLNSPAVQDAADIVGDSRMIASGNMADYLSRAEPLFNAVRLASAQGVGATAGLPVAEAMMKSANDIAQIIVFFVDRLIVQQRDTGVRGDLINAVFELADDTDLLRLLARVRALQGFVGTEDGANLLAGYKRAANILKKEGYPSSLSPSGEFRAGRAPGTTSTARRAVDPELVAEPQARSGEGQSDPHISTGVPLPPTSSGSAMPPASPDQRGALLTRNSPEGEREKKGLSYTPETAEAALIAALDAAEPRARAAVDAEEFEGAMAALASLRAPIDAFFETVTVNDPDPPKREARLALLARVRAAVHAVADFSKIEG